MILLTNTAIPDESIQGLQMFLTQVFLELMTNPIKSLTLIIIAASLTSIAGSLFTLSRSYKKLSKNTSNAESIIKFMNNR